MKNLHTDRLRTGCIPPGVLTAHQALKRFASFQGRLVLSLAALLLCGMAWGQAPERISYQSVVRDLNNDLIASEPVGVQMTILQGASNGPNMYRERHSGMMTNAAGLLSLEIGAGAVQNGSLSAINWSMGPYFVERAIDPLGGTNYTISETTQLLSVPYALYAQSADRANSAVRADVATSLSTTGTQLGAPVGMIAPYSGSAGSVPAGWFLCDGASYEVDLYPELFALIGTAYGSEPNRFKVPDLRGRNPMGREPNQAEFTSLGQIGGAKTHTLTIPEMPGHNHGGITGPPNPNDHKHRMTTKRFVIDANVINKVFELGGSDLEPESTQETQEAGEHTHTISTQGGGGAHNNLQPYLTVNFIIKAN